MWVRVYILCIIIKYTYIHTRRFVDSFWIFGHIFIQIIPLKSENEKFLVGNAVMWVRALGRWGLHSNSYCSGGAHRGERNTKYHVHQQHKHKHKHRRKKQQDHQRMNVAPVLNNHLKSTDHQDHWIIEFNRSKHLDDTAYWVPKVGWGRGRGVPP